MCACVCARSRVCVRACVRACASACACVRKNLIHFIAWGEREREVGRKEVRKAGMKNSKKRQQDDME